MYRSIGGHIRVALMPDPFRVSGRAGTLLCAAMVIAQASCSPTQDAATKESGVPAELAAATSPSEMQDVQPTPADSENQVSEEERELLESLGYLSGIEPLTVDTGVTIYDRQKAWPGINFYVDGSAQGAFLIDMEGELLHEWSYQTAKKTIKGIPWFWRRAYLYPDGSVLAVSNSGELFKVDKDSNLLWIYDQYPHHDVDVDQDGLIYVVAAKREVVPFIHEKRIILNEYIGVLSPDGEEISRTYVLESMRNAGENDLLEQVRDGLRRRKLSMQWKDSLHINSVEVLDGSLADTLPAFQKGNVLISSPHINAIMVLDLKARKITWSHQGRFIAQHHPTMIGNGNLLLFDNHRTKLMSPGVRRIPGDHSAVHEIDPVSGKVVWHYGGSEESPLYSECCGTTYRLDNGNTLITESQSGRVFEVTPKKEIVWTFYTPHTSDSAEELRAQIWDLERFPLDYLKDSGISTEPPSR